MSNSPDEAFIGAWISLLEVRGTTEAAQPAAIVWVMARALSRAQFDVFVAESMRVEGFAVLQQLEVHDARTLTKLLPFDAAEVLAELAKEPIGIVFFDQFHYFPVETS